MTSPGRPLPMDALTAHLLGLHNEPGWTGVLSRQQYPGAYANGLRVEKTEMEKGDAHQIGAKGTVLGSIGHPSLLPRIGYFVEWDATPKNATFIVSNKIREAA